MEKDGIEYEDIVLNLSEQTLGKIGSCDYSKEIKGTFPSDYIEMS